MASGLNTTGFYAENWATSYMLGVEELRNELRDYRQQGYRLTNLTGYNVNGSERYVTLWVKGVSPGWAAMHGLSKEEYMITVEDFRKRNYHLVRVAGYEVKGITKFSAIWENRKGPPVVTKVNMTNEMFKEDKRNFNIVGCTLVHFSAYSVGNTLNIAAIWERRVEPKFPLFACNFLLGELHTKCKECYLKGYVVSSVCGYCINGIDYYAAVFEEKIAIREMAISTGNSHHEYEHQLDTITAQDFTPTYVHAFASGATAKYSVMWNK